MDRKQLGYRGEDLACALLEYRGYEILKRNYVSKHGEIDVIAKKDGVIVFCEVKTRISDVYGNGREAVDWKKVRHIRKTAEYFLMNNNVDFDYAELHVIEIKMEQIIDMI